MNEQENGARSFLIHQADNGIPNVTVRFEGEDVWLTAEQLRTLFQASRQDVIHHIRKIYADGELVREATNKKSLLVRNEGARSVRRQILHYNLDMILAIGMRIRSDVAVRFRQRTIRHLRELAVKGFTLDDGRLKGNLRREMLRYESDFDRAVRELARRPLPETSCTDE